MVIAYDRRAAAAYAHRWSCSRNPGFYDYSEIGGDCTNFVSQCLLAGGGVMNLQPIYGWYYRDANHKAPAWTGVTYLGSFLCREEKSRGPFGRLCSREELETGDVVQLSFDGERFQHSLLIVRVIKTENSPELLLATHSADWDNRPLSSYFYEKVRFIHLEGVRF